jgi:hypothetical protein
VSVHQEVDEELQFHIEMRTRELLERGMDAKTAREIVLSRIGDLGQLKRTCEDLGRKREREMRLTQWLEELRGDVTYAFRQMKATPGFTLVAALTLALGIGANSAMFALADATFLRALPFSGPTDRLVMVWEWRTNGFTSMASPLEFREWSQHNRSFASMATVASGSRTILGVDGTPEQVAGQTVSATFFDVLGVRPITGRTFTTADAVGTPTLVVVSETFWRRRYGADPDLVGREIRVDGQSLTVIGIMPADFQIAAPFSRRADIWRISPTGSEAVRLTHDGGFEPRESPDGRYLFYLDRPLAFLPIGGTARLMRLPLDGGHEEPVLERVRPFLWSVTDTGIVFVTRESEFDAIDMYRFSDQRVARVGRLGFGCRGSTGTWRRPATGAGHWPRRWCGSILTSCGSTTFDETVRGL